MLGCALVKPDEMQQDREKMRVCTSYRGNIWQTGDGETLESSLWPQRYSACFTAQLLRTKESVWIARVLANAGDRKFGKCLKYCSLNGQVQCSGLQHTDQICWS